MNKNKSAIHAILFDIGNVIIQKKQKKVDYIHELCAHFDMPYAPVYAAYHTYVHMYRRGKMTTEDFFTRVFEAGNHPVDISGAQAVYLSIRHATPGMLELIEHLHKNGYTLVLANNQGKCFDEARDHEYDFLKYFEYRCSSWITGYEKPDPQFYKTILSMTGFQAQECVYIDDSPIFIKSAELTGITSILFSDTPTLIKEFKKLGIDC